MPLLVYTARLPCHGQPGYRGEDALDVSRTSSGFGQQFAPSRALLNEALRYKAAAGKSEKAVEEVWQWYGPLYIAEMRKSFRTNRAAWEALLGMEQVTACCWCGRGGRFCHRRLLAEILVRLGATYGGERP